MTSTAAVPVSVVMVSPAPSTAQPLVVWRRALLVLLAAFFGATLVVQAGVNARLGRVVGHGFRASLPSFAIGTCFCVVQAILYGQLAQWRREIPYVRGMPLYMWSAGAIGVTYVIIGLLAVQQIGFALYFVCVVAGQITTSTIFDTIGFAGYTKRRLTPRRLCGVVATIAGAVMLQDYSASSNRGGVAGWCLLGVFAGVLQPFQSAVNVRVRQRLHGAASLVTAISFAVGTIIAAVAAIIISCTADHSFDEYHDNYAIWWAWMGGIIGSFYVTAMTVFTPILGVASFFVSVVAGQLFTSMFMDKYGVFGAIRDSATRPLGIAGVCVAFMGACLIQLEASASSSSALVHKPARPLPSATNDITNHNHDVTIEFTSIPTPTYTATPITSAPLPRMSSFMIDNNNDAASAHIHH